MSTTTVNENVKVKPKKKKLSKSRVFSAIWSVVHGVIVFGICFIILYPLFVKLSVAIRSEKDLYDSTVIYIPRNFSLDTFLEVWNYINYPKVFLNSFVLSFLVSACQVISCTLVGYGFARFNFPGKKIMFGLVILCLIVPPSIIQVPLKLHFQSFDFFGISKYIFGGAPNMSDQFLPFSLLALTCQGLKNGLYIYLIRQTFRGIPKELEEAAYIDGAGYFKTFYRILLPSAKSIMITVFLFSFVWQWTDTFYANIFLSSTDVLAKELPSLAQNLAHKREGALMGMDIIISPAFKSQIDNIGTLLTVTPLFILYCFTQKFFVESIERSGIVG